MHVRSRDIQWAYLALLILSVSFSDAALTNTWTGTISKNWFVTGNWSQGYVPLNGEHVIVPGAVNAVLLTNSTALLGSFSIINQTLTCSNWNARILATSVTVYANGKLVLPGPFAMGAMSNRIWIVCTNLLVNPGGQIDADYNGYMVAQGTGKGQQSGSNNNGGGGFGGRGGDEAGGSGGPTYGLTNAPVEPGSGGGRWTSSPLSNGSGGGVIRIEAVSALISGTLSARGRIGNTYDGGGSGGSIYLTCNTFGGTGGVLRVDGGEGGSAYGGGGGGGGRIAFIYSTVVGSPLIEFSARAGALHTLEAAGHGTVYLPDTALIEPATIGTRFKDVRLVIPGFTRWDLESLTLTNGAVSLGEHDFQMTITNDLVIAQGATLVLGGIPLVSTNSLGTDGMGTNPWLRVGNNLTLDDGNLILGGRGQGSFTRLTVGGSVTLTNGGQLVVYTGVTNSVMTNGAMVTITGNLDIASGAWYRPWSLYADSGASRLMVDQLIVRSGGGINPNWLHATCMDFLLESGGVVDANYRGFRDETGPGKGLGSGSNTGSGAGHGGKGGDSASYAGGPSYGSSNAPVLPGSGGGGTWDHIGGNGGGVVWIDAKNTITLDGTITANGENGGQYNGGGSGGSIFIRGYNVKGGGIAILRANGGNRGTGYTNLGGGAGGRIAVWYKVTPGDYAKILSGALVKRVQTFSAFAGYAGAVTADGGAGYENGSTGTVVFLTLEPISGTMMVIR